jgi:putative transposase
LLIYQFIADHRAEFGVVPICRALRRYDVQIAPRSFYAWVSRGPSRRGLWELVITELLASYYEPDAEGRRPAESLYGSLKMWAHLQRQGVQVARCTVERLMRRHGWRGVTRRRRPRTTVSDPTAERAPDLVHRRFHTDRPDALWVADFTYVPVLSGFVYTAFVIDAFAGMICGWQVSGTKHTRFVKQAVADAVQMRARQGHPLAGGTIHHSDAGSQYTSLRFGEQLVLNQLSCSIGSVGDAYDNALAETTIGLYKTECIRTDSPFRRGPLQTVADVEALTAAWVHWYNQQRLMHRLGRRPPSEAEAEYHRQQADQLIGKI